LGKAYSIAVVKFSYFVQRLMVEALKDGLKELLHVTEVNGPSQDLVDRAC
jgi:hypothetical protein